MKRILLALHVLVFSVGESHAQEEMKFPKADTLKFPAADSLPAPLDTLAVPLLDLSARRDSLIAASRDSIAKKDTLRFKIFPFMGSLSAKTDSHSIMYQAEFLWTDALSLVDLLPYQEGIFLRRLAEFGQPDQVNSYGWRGVAFFLDGRPVNDIITGEIFPYEYPLEFIRNIESLRGAGAFRSPGPVAYNMVTRQYNVAFPVSKLRFVQGPDNMTLTDGLFTQNITRQMNLTFGFQSLVTDGSYPNTGHSAWNVRARLRYNLSEQFNLSLTNMLTFTSVRMNGGVNFAVPTLLFDPVTAVVKHRSIWQKTYKNDLHLLGVGTFLGDTLQVTRVGFYHTSLERQYEEPDEINLTKGFFDLHEADRLGLTAEQTLFFEPFHITAGFLGERKRILSSPVFSDRSLTTLSAYGKLAYGAGADFFQPSIFVRTERNEASTSFSAGGALVIHLSDSYNLFATVSRSARYPTLQELYWNDTLVIRSAPLKEEEHLFMEAGMQVFSGSDLNLRLAAFSRTINAPIVFEPLPTPTLFAPEVFTRVAIRNAGKAEILGAVSSLHAAWKGFALHGSATLQWLDLDGAKKTWFPEAVYTAELSYRRLLFDDELDAKVAVRVRGASSSLGLEHHPRLLGFVDNSANVVGAYIVPDFYGVFLIGNAHIMVAWENPFGLQYIASPIYPMSDMAFRLGVNWIFFD